MFRYTAAPDTHRPDVFTPAFRRGFAANLLADLSFSLFVHFPGFLSGLGAGEAVIGLVAGVAAAASVSVRPSVGQLMDHRGRPPVIAVAAALRFLSALLFFTITSIGPWVFVVRALYAISQAVMFTGLFTYASDHIPEARRTEGLALYGLSGMVPGMFGAALGDLLVHVGGYQSLFLAIAGLDLAALLVTITLDWTTKVHESHERVGFLRVARIGWLYSVWILTAAFGLAFGCLLTFVRTFVDETSLGTVGLFFFCYSATAVLLRVFFSTLPDRVGLTRVLYPAVGSLAAGLALLAAARSLGAFVAAAVLSGAGHAFLFPILSRLVVDRSLPGARGAGMGLYTSLFDLAILVGGPAMGWVIERAGYSAMFSSLAVLVLGGALAFAWRERVTVAPVALPVERP